MSDDLVVLAHPTFNDVTVTVSPRAADSWRDQGWRDTVIEQIRTWGTDSVFREVRMPDEPPRKRQKRRTTKTPAGDDG